MLSNVSADSWIAQTSETQFMAQTPQSVRAQMREQPFLRTPVRFLTLFILSFQGADICMSFDCGDSTVLIQVHTVCMLEILAQFLMQSLQSSYKDQPLQTHTHSNTETFE